VFPRTDCAATDHCRFINDDGEADPDVALMPPVKSQATTNAAATAASKPKASKSTASSTSGLTYHYVSGDEDGDGLQEPLLSTNGAANGGGGSSNSSSGDAGDGGEAGLKRRGRRAKDAVAATKTG
jgi:hypothetical protein